MLRGDVGHLQVRRRGVGRSRHPVLRDMFQITRYELGMPSGCEKGAGAKARRQDSASVHTRRMPKPASGCKGGRPPPGGAAAVAGETGDRRQETGDRRQETGDRGQETGDRGQETGDGGREVAVGSGSRQWQGRRRLNRRTACRVNREGERGDRGQGTGDGGREVAVGSGSRQWQ